MLPKPALLSSIEVPEPALSLSSAGLALLRVLAVSMYFIGTILDNGTTQSALYRPPHCSALGGGRRKERLRRDPAVEVVWNQSSRCNLERYFL